MDMNVRNVHDALRYGVRMLRDIGVKRDSRNGPVWQMREPVMTRFERPVERVLFHRERDANPFFHFFESLWMLAGRNDIAFLVQFVTRMATFSDDGETLNGAYGMRWKNWFIPRNDWGNPHDSFVSVDQLAIIAERLRSDPTDRRSVLAMWDAGHDLGLSSKDLPCNTHIYFGVNDEGKLDMTVCCRSNDLIWGLCGANAVHFSVLQEYMAARIGVPLGTYYHLSNNYHAYLNVIEPLLAKTALETPCQYTLGYVKPYPIIGEEGVANFDLDLELFFQNKDGRMRTEFFRELVVPLFNAHLMFKTLKGETKYRETIAYLEEACTPCDWQQAAINWVDYRFNNFLEAQRA